ncbi:hypothetical protein ACKFKG_22115 [Phormidesmis sp. 146-35]
MNQHQTYSQRVLDAISSRQGIDPLDLDIRIQYGKNGRIILGELASGEQRNEVNQDRAELILSALEKPAVDRVDLSSYSGRKPMLEVINKGETLFRQERDGTISINTLCHEQELSQKVALESNPSNSVQAELSSSDIVMAARRVAQAAEGLLNPLWQEKPTTTIAEIGSYKLHLDRDTLTVSKDENVLVQIVDGQIQPSQGVTSEDVQAFEGWARNGEGVWEEQKVLLEDMPRFMWQTNSQVSEASESHHTNALEVAKQQIVQLQESNSKAFFQNLFEDLSKQATQAIQQNLSSDQFKTTQKIVVEGAKTAFQTVKQGLESDQFKAFQKQTAQALQDRAEKAIETAGHGIERVGQWLASRPEAIREHRAARTTYELFEQGFARTQEHRYELNGFKVELQGRNNFMLRDAVTDQELLRFKAEKLLFGEPRITILSKAEAGISHEQYQAIDQARQDIESVRGSQIAEARHAEKSAAFGSAARMVAEFNETNDYNGKHYRIQINQDSLTITTKDGRGTIYQQQGDQVKSRLEQQDFGRFAQAIKTIEQQQPNLSEQRQVGIG